LKTSSDPLHAQEKEHDFLLDAFGGEYFDAKSDRLLEEQNWHAAPNAADI
jgi:hypothetical protein